MQYGKVDLRQSPQLGQEYGVSRIPDTRIFHNGKEIGGFVGARGAGHVEDLVVLHQSTVRPEGEAESGGEVVAPAIRPERVNRALPQGIVPIPST